MGKHDVVGIQNNSTARLHTQWSYKVTLAMPDRCGLMWRRQSVGFKMGIYSNQGITIALLDQGSAKFSFLFPVITSDTFGSSQAGHDAYVKL